LFVEVRQFSQEIAGVATRLLQVVMPVFSLAAPKENLRQHIASRGSLTGAFQPAPFDQLFQIPVGRSIGDTGQLPVDPVRDKAMFLNILQRLDQSHLYLLGTTILYHYLRMGILMLFPERSSLILRSRLWSA